MEKKLMCNRCKVTLEPRKVDLDYLGYRLTNEFLCCPICKEPYLPEEIVQGKMHDVEILLEDK